MLEVGLLFKIGAVGILTIVIAKILETSGYKEYATITNIAGIVIIFFMVITLISRLFSTVRTMFQL